MPLYMCRWANGDISFVSAVNRRMAVELLDEVGNAEGCPIVAVNDFMVHFGLTDEGSLELQGWGETTEDQIFRNAYPLLNRALMSAADDFDNCGPEDKAAIIDAVGRERKRVQAEPRSEPDTEAGRTVKERMDLPTDLIDRLTREEND